MIPLLPLATMSKPQAVTAWLVFIAVVVLCVWDVVATVNRHANDTISQVTLQISLDHPVVLLLTMFICGHLFLPQSRDLPTDVAALTDARMLLCIVGLYLGHRYWPQYI